MPLMLNPVIWDYNVQYDFYGVNSVLFQIVRVWNRFFIMVASGSILAHIRIHEL